MHPDEFAAISGGRDFATWLVDLKSTSGPIAFVDQQQLQTIPQVLAASSWLLQQYTDIKREADACLNIPITLPTRVNGHGHEFVCIDGTILTPLPDEAGGRCPRCGRTYTDDKYREGAAYIVQMSYIRMAAVLATVYSIEQDPAYAKRVVDILEQFANLYSGHGQLVRQTLDEAWRITVLAHAFDLVAHDSRILPTSRDVISKQLLRASAQRIYKGYDRTGNWGACHDVGIGVIGLVLRDEELLSIALEGFVRRAHTYFHTDGLGVEGSIGSYHLMTVANMMSLAEAFLPSGINLYQARFQHGSHTRIIEGVLDAPISVAFPDTRIPALHDGWYYNGCVLPADQYEMAYRRYRKPIYRQVADTFYAKDRFQGEPVGDAMQQSASETLPTMPHLLPSYPLVWDFYVHSLLTPAYKWVEQPQHIFPPRLFWQSYDVTATQVDDARHAVVVVQPEAQQVMGAEQPAAVPQVGTRNLRLPSVHFPASGFVVMRAPESDTYLLCDYGPHGGGHGHTDKLNLILYANGRVLVPDYGTPAYGLKVKSGWYQRTISHNTIMVDGKNQVPSEAKLRHLDLTAPRQLFHALAGDAYPGITMERRIALHNGLVVLLDTVESCDQHTYDWLLHARGELTLPEQLAKLPDLEPHFDYVYLHDASWYSSSTAALDTSNRFTWCSPDGVGLHMWWAASNPVKVMSAYGPGAIVDKYDPMVALRITASKAWYAVLLEPILGQSRVVNFNVVYNGATGWQYRVQLTGGEVVRGVFAR